MVRFVRVLIEMLDPAGVERGGAPLDAVNRVSLLQQQFRKVGAILSRRPGDQCNFADLGFCMNLLVAMASFGSSRYPVVVGTSCRFSAASASGCRRLRMRRTAAARQPAARLTAFMRRDEVSLAALFRNHRGTESATDAMGWRTPVCAAARRMNHVDANSRKIFPILLSGGAGSRLWPLSREDCPKQLLPLVSERTLLQQTAMRTANPRPLRAAHGHRQRQSSVPDRRAAAGDRRAFLRPSCWSPARATRPPRLR